MQQAVYTPTQCGGCQGLDGGFDPESSVEAVAGPRVGQIHPSGSLGSSFLVMNSCIAKRNTRQAIEIGAIAHNAKVIL